MISRREVVGGGTILLVGSVFVDASPASAFSLGKIFKGVATTIVQGVGIATKPVDQLVHASVDVLKNTVRQVGDSAAGVVNDIENGTTAVIDQAVKFAGEEGAKILPLFANTGFSLQQLDFLQTQAGKLLSLGTSSEDELRSDPSGYVQRNGEYLMDQVNTFPQQIGTTTINAAAGQFGIGRVAAGTPPGRGYYPSVLSLSDVLKLVTLLAAF